MAMAAVIVVASSLVNLTFDVGLNALQNLSDAVYQDAFWSRRDVSSPELERIAQEEEEVARLMARPTFAVAPAMRPELATRP
jgi:hypothetical protein